MSPPANLVAIYYYYLLSLNYQREQGEEDKAGHCPPIPHNIFLLSTMVGQNTGNVVANNGSANNNGNANNGRRAGTVPKTATTMLTSQLTL